MDDNAIIRLYWDRNEQAIRVTSEKYGHYCKTIAKNILCSEEDAKECVNDTWLGAWNAMPSHWPEQLSTFLGKITRNLAFNRYRHDHAKKRGGGEITLVLDELSDCVSDDDVERTIDQQGYPEAKDDFIYLGKITSDISNDQTGNNDGTPKENFQANDPIAGCEVYLYGENIVVKINGAYWLYRKYGEEKVTWDDLSELNTITYIENAQAGDRIAIGYLKEDSDISRGELAVYEIIPVSE